MLGPTRLFNPYQGGRGQWVRGNLHGHCREHSRCASVPLVQGARMYRGIGARFMAVTDHDWVTDLEAVRLAYPDMVFLEGFEHSRDGHLLFVGQSVPSLFEFGVEDALLHAGDLLTIAAHPQPRKGHEHWTLEKILALRRHPDGIEIYDGHYGIERLRARGASPQYTHFWDDLLTHGLRLWGFADDDFHDPPDFDNAFNMVLVEDLTAAAIIRAAKSGRCYASTGLILGRIREANGHIAVEVGTPCVGRFIGPHGVILHESAGTTFAYRVRDEAYVRFEAEGRTGQLFLQPMFRQDYSCAGRKPRPSDRDAVWSCELVRNPTNGQRNGLICTGMGDDRVVKTAGWWRSGKAKQGTRPCGRSHQCMSG